MCADLQRGGSVQNEDQQRNLLQLYTTGTLHETGMGGLAVSTGHCKPCQGVLGLEMQTCVLLQPSAVIRMLGPSNTLQEENSIWRRLAGSVVLSKTLAIGHW